MADFLIAHGYDPGPTQRPLLAGAIAGVLATIPAIAILTAFGSLRTEAQIFRFGEHAVVAGGAVAMAIAGSLYGRLFGRAANDRRGGWLFAMAFGFFLWAGGAVLVIPLINDGLTPVGTAAIGLFLSMIGWGASLGVIFPLIHRRLHEGLQTGAQHKTVGPDAAASRQRQDRDRVRPPPEELSSRRRP